MPTRRVGLTGRADADAQLTRPPSSQQFRGEVPILVDKVAVSVRGRPRGTRWRHPRPKHAWVADRSKFTVSYSGPPTGGAYWMRVMWNPSKVRLAGAQDASVAGLLTSAEAVWEVAQRYLDPLDVDDLLDVRLGRLDLAVDFADVPGRVFTNGMYRAPRAGNPHPFFAGSEPIDPNEVRAVYVPHGTRAVGARSIDIAYYRPPMPPISITETGTLRIECRFSRRNKQLFRGVDRLRDLTPESAREMYLARWERGAWGYDVVGHELAVRRAVALEWSPARRNAFIGWMLVRAQGLAPGVSAPTERGFMKAMRDLRLVVAPPGLVPGAYAAHLDLSTCRAVVHGGSSQDALNVT